MGRHALENLALEVDELGQRLLDELASVEPREPDPVLESFERRRDLLVLDHALLGHQAEVAPDLATGVGEYRGGPSCGPILEVHERHLVSAEGERERDLAPDPPGSEHGDSIHRFAPRRPAARAATLTPSPAHRS